jgi:hypothetical protein
MWCKRSCFRGLTLILFLYLYCCAVSNVTFIEDLDLLECDAVSLDKYVREALIFRVKQSKMTVDDCITLKM